MAGSSVSGMLMNPKFLAKATYLLFIGFGCFHLTRIGLALVTSLFVSRFGKPNLVRETSKLYTKNYFSVPFLYARKMMH
jgi:hypothetical protein